MGTVEVYNWDKKKVGEVEVPKFLEVPFRPDLLQEVVTWQLACRRQGTHMTKTKGMVRGGGKKPFKQKGTGNARQGSSRSPLMPGGGTMFGPQPKDYSYSLPKKVRKAGLRSAFSYLLKNKKLFVVKEMSSEGKSKELSQRLKNFGVTKAVLIDSTTNDLFDRASRNLKNFRYLEAKGVNVFDLLKYDSAILTPDSFSQIVARCGDTK